jgi:hypothetical protein
MPDKFGDYGVREEKGPVCAAHPMPCALHCVAFPRLKPMRCDAVRGWWGAAQGGVMFDKLVSIKKKPGEKSMTITGGVSISGPKQDEMRTVYEWYTSRCHPFPLRLTYCTGAHALCAL